MHYEIRHGHKTGRQLTTAQRTSGTFAEEPIVLGKVLRRGSRPVRLTAEQFEQHKAKLLRQLMAGSIEIFRVDEDKDPVRCEYRALRGLSSPDEPKPSTGDLVAKPGGAGPAPAAPPKKEELEAGGAPPSSAPSGTPEPDEGEEEETEPAENTEDAS